MYFDQSCRAFCAGCGQYGIFMLLFGSRRLTYRHLQCVVFARHCAGVMYGLSALPSHSSSLVARSSKVRQKDGRGSSFSGQHSGSRDFRSLQFSSQRASVERGQTRRNKVPTPRASHLAPPLNLRTTLHFKQFDYSVSFSRTAHVTYPFPRRAERRPSGLRQGVRKIEAFRPGVNIYNGGQLRQ